MFEACLAFFILPILVGLMVAAIVWFVGAPLWAILLSFLITALATFGAFAATAD